MLKRSLSAVLATAMLLSPLHVSAENSNAHIRLTPPADMSASASVGKLTICCDSSMKGTIFELHLYQEEGDLQYYRFTSNYKEETEIECPLMKNGDYMLVVRVPQADSSEARSYLYPFGAEDPDPADHPSDFDSTELTMHFQVDPTLDADTEEVNEPVLVDRIYTGESHCSYARQAFSAGDVNSDGTINAKDATSILVGAAALGVGKESGLSSLAVAEGDVNGDGSMNAKDAAFVLSYAAALGVKAFEGSIDEYILSRNMQ